MTCCCEVSGPLEQNSHNVMFAEFEDRNSMNVFVFCEERVSVTINTAISSLIEALFIVSCYSYHPFIRVSSSLAHTRQVFGLISESVCESFFYQVFHLLKYVRLEYN